MLYEVTVSDGDSGRSMPGGDLTLCFTTLARAFAQAVPWIEQGYVVTLRELEDDE